MTPYHNPKEVGACTHTQPLTKLTTHVPILNDVFALIIIIIIYYLVVFFAIHVRVAHAR